jgi:putative oxidoreductase
VGAIVGVYTDRVGRRNKEECAMAKGEAKLLYPGLAGFYETMLPIAETLMRVVGLFTRFFAAALAVEMLVALLYVHLPKGYPVGGGGYEYVLLIGAACFAIAIRGGGPYSLDRVIGKQL